MRRALWFAALLGMATIAQAGQDCRSEVVSPNRQADAAAQALTVAERLDAVDAPVALVARVGTDLSKHGLRYSHVGFVLRDAADGRSTVVHLLNTCGTDRSALYADGLVDYYADARVALDNAIVWLDERTAAEVVRVLDNRDAARLHDPDYKVIAHPHSDRYQNSTAWVMETLALAMQPGAPPDRRAAQAWAQAHGHRPTRLHIPYSKRIAGGLFSANAHFTDHALSARLAGEYDVVTVDSIFAWLERGGRVAHREDLQRPGPATR